jgi:Tfp pilus assembly protein PilV
MDSPWTGCVIQVGQIIYCIRLGWVKASVTRVTRWVRNKERKRVSKHVPSNMSPAIVGEMIPGCLT